MYELLLILFSGNKFPLHIEKQNHYYYFEAKVYLELSRTSMMERFCDNSSQFLAVNYFRKNAPSQMFDWVLNRSKVYKFQTNLFPYKVSLILCAS